MCLDEVPHDAQPLGPVQWPEGIAVPILPLAPETLDHGASNELISPYCQAQAQVQSQIQNPKSRGKGLGLGLTI